jgi:hypothetical protein
MGCGEGGGGGKSTLLEESEASPAGFSDRNSTKMKVLRW